ncbi:ThuA domain-containing protein [Altererythrobacter sp. H2]|uniref:ThuA domain-containing protein n=1 Tax=Altererythrobacter sp. H2 TaxID=3108391 RepID=UPI002B4BA982|nr:ThuA domain-containing protein [Altererythrobacter sp. H2]WRK95940.1 ThuA domain-containing protein [Altererythrobacter sp. H2]
MRRLLVLSGGHPYEEAPFAALLASLEGWQVTHLVHPEAEKAVADGAAAEADAILFYDMPGYTFAEGTVTTRPPSEGYKAAIRAHFAAGRGAVAWHHALAGWAEWPEWAEMVGGRFLYQPGETRGLAMPDSGYRHDVAYTAEVLADHAVTAGLPNTFELCDELYLAPVFEDRVEPLLRARHAFVAGNFYSAALAVGGQMFSNAGWEHPPGSDLIAWHRTVGNGRLVYLQPGDGPATYANPHVRQLLGNALDFLSAPPA